MEYPTYDGHDLLGQTRHCFSCLVRILPQSFPPHLGGGLLQSLLRVCRPVMHILLQLDQEVHSDTPPLTVWTRVENDKSNFCQNGISFNE